MILHTPAAPGVTRENQENQGEADSLDHHRLYGDFRELSTCDIRLIAV